ncbi:MAG: hypothetical protein LBK94_00930 [Prevotellaceae bacterium]|jgi:hypothetical protein|nr:hypothetical protein [Prevotellaceae bacterium]
MKLTKAQYDTVSESFPTRRGNVSLSNLEVLNAILMTATVCGINGIASCLIPALEAYDNTK